MPRHTTAHYAEAVKWDRLAAQQGHAEAQFNLGTMYGSGRGVRRDYGKAHMWYSLAIARSGDDVELRDRATRNRDAIAGKMNTNNIAKAQKRASDWEAALKERQQAQ